jgi:hypothetical protein
VVILLAQKKQMAREISLWLVYNIHTLEIGLQAVPALSILIVRASGFALTREHLNHETIKGSMAGVRVLSFYILAMIKLAGPICESLRVEFCGKALTNDGGRSICVEPGH